VNLHNDSRIRLGGRRRLPLSLQVDGPGGGGITYLLLDRFTDTRAAGAVNGTPATPGPGVRTVVDGNSKLSIGAGVANFATGGVTVGNPGLWYESVGRAYGRVVIGAMILGPTSATPSIGWDTNQGGVILYYIGFQSTSIYIDDLILVAVFANNTTYLTAVVMRANGMYYFIKGGLYTNWTLLWSHSSGSAAGYPSVGSASGTLTVFTADNIRVPVTLYNVPVLAYDTFTRADGALGSTETAGPDAQAVTARAWTAQVGTWAIASNVAGATALAGGIAIATYDAGSADVLHDVAATRAAGNIGAVYRYADSSNYLIAYHDGTNAKLDKVVAGVTTNLISAAATYSAGAVVRAILSGTEARLFYNNAAVGSLATAPASSATLHGLYTTDTTNSLDNAQTLARGTGNEYGGLDAL